MTHFQCIHELHQILRLQISTLSSRRQKSLSVQRAVFACVPSEPWGHLTQKIDSFFFLRMQLCCLSLCHRKPRLQQV